MSYTPWPPGTMRPRRLLAVFLAGAMAALVAGCAGTAGPAGPADSNHAATSRSVAGRDITTASDESETRRRARIRLELATAYFGRGQLTTALDEVKQVLAIDNGLTEAYELRGLIYDALNEPALAEESFRRAIELDARNGSALHNYAWFLCRRQQYAAADAHFARAGELPMTVAIPKTLLARGVCQMEAGLMAEAERTLARSYELDPSNPATAFNRALVLYRLGDFDRARFYIRRVNNVPEQATAASLWLAVRIEHRLGNAVAKDELATQLRSRFPSSREVTLLELGRFDE